MADDRVATALSFKRQLEAEFEAATSLPGRSYYSAVYSLPQKSPVIWLNLNPGGTPDDYQVLSDHQLALGQHEFWHGHGKTSKATGTFLGKVFPDSLRRLRSVQGTNVAWERSRSGADIDLASAARRCAPSLISYLRYVSPSVLMFGGSSAFDLFLKSHGCRLIRQVDVLMGNWGTNQARIFVATEVEVPQLGALRTITVSHPSRGVRAGVAERCRVHLSDVHLPDAIV